MNLRVVIDNRIRMPSETPAELVKRLKAATTHVNPDYGKARALGHWTGNVPGTIKTWLADARGCNFSLPRGVANLVRSHASSLGIEIRWVDKRMSVPVEWKPFLVEPRPYQVDGIAACVLREQGIVRAPTGCISGDAIIGVNRAGKSFKLSLSELVRRQHGGVAGWRVWNPSIPTTVRGRDRDGYVRLVPLIDAYESGEKLTYSVQTSTGHEVRATAEHWFLTEQGWKELQDVSVGMNICVEGERGNGGGARRRPQYKIVNGVRWHPFAGRHGVRSDKGGVSVPAHRLVMEAQLNKVPYDDFVACLRADEQRSREFVFLDPAEYAVHHIDENSHNNAASNLEICTHVEHHRRHGLDGGWKHVNCPTAFAEVVEIRQFGMEPTFDLSLDEPNNFLANGIVVHNSGKTSMALGALPQLRQRSLVIVRDRNLLEQWVERAERELGLKRREVGVVSGGKRKVGELLTLSLQQTLYSKSFPLAEFAQQFGAVLVDEVHEAAAKTVGETVDAFPARVRLGFSADHRRRDRKEFLSEDLFGEVIYEVGKKQLEGQGHVVPVVVRLVPTEFCADWYVDAPTEERDFTKLITEMSVDVQRDLLLRRVVLELVSSGCTPVLVFTHRREHASRLAERELPADGVPTGLLLGSVESAVQFEESKSLLLKGVLKVAVGTFKACGQGIDLPNVMAGVCATPIGANKQFFGQVRGRVCRVWPGKEVGYLYYLWDEQVFPDAGRNLVNWNDGQVEIFDQASKQWTAY